MMTTVLTANWQPKWQNGAKKYSKDLLLAYLKAQIDNHIDLWGDTSELMILSSFPFEYRGISALEASCFKDLCPTGSKTFAADWYLNDMGLVIPWHEGDVVWFHDLDLWPLVKTDVPAGFQESDTDVALCRYNNSYNGGSVFYKQTAWDMVGLVRHWIEHEIAPKEEPVLNKQWVPFKDRITVLNDTYNVGCTAMDKRLNAAVKPVHGIHFHVESQAAWDRFTTAGLIDGRLSEILHHHFKGLVK